MKSKLGASHQDNDSSDFSNKTRM